MFKKFKDKLAEEMKQSPARLQASMQQLAQAVSPSLSNSSIQDLSSTRDNFSLTDEADETPKNSPEKHGFQTIDLTPPSVNSNTSRRSSVSSNVSDVSFLFPTYESPGTTYLLQSDMDQSASDIDESISPQLDRVSKEQLYTTYRKARSKYDKYRGRYTDLANHYRVMEKEKSKLESLLVETQDKALRRISDLKEQCQLEQQAKAHLEDALRNDIEEKDHVINSLRTKIKLLQEKGPNAEGLENIEINENHKNSKDLLVDLSCSKEEVNSEVSLLTAENTQLKEKLQKMDGFLEKYKDMLKKNKEKMFEITNEKNIVERDYDILQKSSKEKFENMEIELNSSRKELERVKQEIDVLRKREEECVLSLAENKLSIHRELEGKEDKIKKLESELKQTHELEKSLRETTELQKQEIGKMKIIANQKAEESQQHLKTKLEALKQKEQLQKKLIDFEKEVSLKYNDELNKNNKLSCELAALEELSKKLESEKLREKEELEQKLIDLEKEMSSKYNEEVNKNKELLSKVKILENQLNEDECKENLNEYKTINENLKKELTELTIFKSNMETYVNNIKTVYEKEVETLKVTLAEKDNVCNALNIQIEEHVDSLEQVKQKLQHQDDEIKVLKASHDEDISKLQKELENKTTEILELSSELKSRAITIIDLKKEMNNLVNHVNSLSKCLKTCKKYVKSLKQDYMYFKKDVNSNLSDGRSAIIETIGETFKVFPLINKENKSLECELNQLHKKTCAIDELQNSYRNSNTQMEKILSEKVLLEKELADRLSEIEEMKIKVSSLNELEIKHKSLTSDIENFNKKLSEVEELSKVQYETALNEVLLKLSEKEHDCKFLHKQFDELSEKYKQTVDAENALKSEKNNYNVALEEIERLKSELTFVKEELDKKNLEVQNLQAKNSQEEQQYSKTRNECINYKHLLEENNQKLSLLNEELENSKIVIKNLTAASEESKDSLQKALESKTQLMQKLKTFKEKLQKTEEEKNNAIADVEQEKLKLKDAKEQWNQSLNSMIEENKQLKKRHQSFAELEEELKASKILLEALKNEKDKAISTLDELRLECDLLRNENKSLEGKQNDLLKLNDVLNQSQNNLMDRVRNLENKNNDLVKKKSTILQELEICRCEMKNTSDEMEKLKSQVVQLEDVKLKNNELSALLNKAREFELKNVSLEKKVKALMTTNESLGLEIDSLTKKVCGLEEHRAKNEKLIHEVQNYKCRIIELEDSLSSKVREIDSLSQNAQGESHNLKIELEERESALKYMESKNAELLEEIDKLSSLKLSVEEKSTREIDELQKTFKECETRLAEKDFLLEESQKKCTELEREITNITKLSSNLEELSKNVDHLMQEKMKLESQLDETLVTFQAKESQMQAFNDELRNQILKLREQLRINEDEQNLRLKQISKEFQAQLQDKEKELQAALEKRYDHLQNYESDTIQEYKEQLKDFQVELTKKSQNIVNLKLENEKLQKESQEEVEKLSATINQLKSENMEQMQEIDKKWKNFIQQKTSNLEIKHEREVAELTTEWQNERKSDENSDITDKELENTTKVAMATVQSNTSSFHTLQQTLLSQKRELAELRKLVKMRQESVEDSTEIEYLRNILFKYMMGKETLVLARVIAAVLKFDQDQTSKILKREEDKQSLLGSLGLT